MKAEGLKYFTDAPIIILALFLFMICFIGFVFWVYRKGSMSFYQRVAELPLHEPSLSQEVDHV